MPPKANRNQRSRKNAKGPRRGPHRRNQVPATAKVGRTAAADLRYAVPLYPPRFRKRLVYSEVALSLSSTAGSSNSYFFSCNGLFDPNTTGTGHQPMGFDQLMLSYEQYTVVSSKVSFECLNASAANIFQVVGVYLSPDTTSIVVPSRFIENGLIVFKMLDPIGLAKSFCSLSLDCNIPTYFGLNRNKRALVGDANLFGTVAANPSEQAYFGLVCYDPTLVNATSVDFTVILEYDVIFWEPRKLTQS